MKIVKKLKERRSIKLFDGSLLPESKVDKLIKACNLSPTSLGIQPVRLVVISSSEVKTILKSASYNQPQIESCSHLFVLCIKESITKSYVKQYIKLISEKRKVSKESLKGFKTMIYNWLGKKTQTEYLEWAKNQAYLTLGTLIATCASEGISTCPIEGFDPSSYNKILNLRDEGLESVIICALGKSHKDDPRSKEAKVRIPNKEYLVKSL